MLIGDSADAVARDNGLLMVTNDYFTTEYRRAHVKLQTNPAVTGIVEELGTVGAVVLDVHGHLAAAGSTGGTAGKNRGRIGDTAILGAGLYADAQVGIVW